MRNSVREDHEDASVDLSLSRAHPIIVSMVVLGAVAAMIIVPHLTPEKTPGSLATSAVSVALDGLRDGVYTDTEYGIHFSPPPGFSVQKVVDADMRGDVLVLQDMRGNGIQIGITPQPYAPITEKVLRASIPDLVIRNPRDILVGKKREKGEAEYAPGVGVSFESENELFGGPTREVWFMQGDRLFQITAPASVSESVISSFISSWHFE